MTPSETPRLRSVVTQPARRLWALYRSGSGPARSHTHIIQTHACGLKLPNNWGLHDMVGNVTEWVQDWYRNDHYSDEVGPPWVDPTGPENGSDRVMRCGGYNTNEASSRSAGRHLGATEYANSDVGFRLAVSPTME